MGDLTDFDDFEIHRRGRRYEQLFTVQVTVARFQFPAYSRSRIFNIRYTCFAAYSGNVVVTMRLPRIWWETGPFRDTPKEHYVGYLAEFLLRG